jgi:hypothetical protein
MYLNTRSKFKAIEKPEKLDKLLGAKRKLKKGTFYMKKDKNNENRNMGMNLKSQNSKEVLNQMVPNQLSISN